MTPRGHPLRWLPPLLVGVCAATAAEVAVGLLLYGGPGFMRSLTTVLAVEAGALGLGFWTAPGRRPDLVDALRRRWLLCLIAFLGATVFAALWSMVELLGGSALGQGLGLAFLAALPLYAVGGLLGAMATLGATEPAERPGSLGGAVGIGAALGFAVTGASLVQVFTPASLLLACLVFLSGGGLVYGAVLDARLRVHVRARRPADTGEVRIEDRHLPSREQAARALLEADHVRRWTTLSSEADAPWDVAVFRALAAERPEPVVLLVGGGASALPRVALSEYAGARVDVVERSHAVLDLGREHLETGLHAGADGRLRLWVGNVQDAIASLPGPYDLVLVDTGALAPLGGLSAISSAERAALSGRVAASGWLVIGPRPHRAANWPLPDGWSRWLYRRPLPEELDALGFGLAGQEEILVCGVAQPAGTDLLGSFEAEAAVDTGVPA